MFRFSAAAPTAPVSRFLDLVAHWNLGNPLGKSLADYSEDELDGILTATGKTRADLFDVFKGNARHRQSMAQMMSHFGVDRLRAVQIHWNALKHAEQICMRCAHTKRCRSWFDWGKKNDAPRIFCPCAPLFDEIARANRNSPPASPNVGDGRGH